MAITSQANFGDWLGFLGPYIGGVISGVITLGGVLLGFKRERKKNIDHRYLYLSKSEIDELSEDIEEDFEFVSNCYD